MKISFITTVFNEEKTIKKFLDSLLFQTKLPDELVIVDGNSTDETVERIKNQESRIKGKKIKFKLIVKQGNRSVGRNEAIKQTSGNIIVCSDSGNILDKDWLKNITKPFGDQSVDVVAGYYKGRAKNIFQKSLIPYVLVMPDKVDPDTFLPATRSIAFTKSIWKKVGGFDEQLSHNEDYAFAKRLRDKKATIVFAKDAIVYWIPRDTFKEAFIMFSRFALGDAEAGILRTTVLLLFARYFLGLYGVFLAFLYQSFQPIVVLLITIVFYIFWAIKKNYRYVGDKGAFITLPLLQFTADGSVLFGTLYGFLKRIMQVNYVSYVKKNKFLFFILSFYIFIMLLTLRWGIPSQQHPFPYHMDEWHQLQAVANTFRFGTPNTEGSANGTMLHFLLSGFYLIPFTLIQYINPFALQIDNALMREKVFAVLRLQTIVFGSLSIFMLYRITKLLHISKKIVLFLFTFTPVWLLLSGYFKYDIALVFWLLLSFFFLFRFAKEPSDRNFIIAAIPSALAVAVKISAMPLFVIYMVSYFWFGKFSFKKFKIFFAGVVVFISCVLLFGMPDRLFGKGNILLYLYDNIIHSPQQTTNFKLTVAPLVYLFTRHYPIVFGYGFMFLFIFSIIFWIYKFTKGKIIHSIKKYSIELFLFFIFTIFLLSIVPLQLFAAGNRSLVLLPIMALVIGMTYKQIKNSFVKHLLSVVIGVVCVVQLYQCFAWIYIKVVQSPQAVASEWIQQHITKGQTIGLENIPIYQYIPEVIQKEFYYTQYGIQQKADYTYKLVTSGSKQLPEIIVITNGEIETMLLQASAKKELVQRLQKKNYKKVIVFTPDYRYFRFFGNEIDYYLSGLLVASPNTITVYTKEGSH